MLSSSAWSAALDGVTPAVDFRPTPILSAFQANSFASEWANPLSSSTFSSSSAPVREVAFVDAALPDYQTLVDGLRPGTAVYLLSPAGDALSQISSVLVGYSNLSAVSIFSHGSNGALQLGNTSLNTDNLIDYAGVLQSWAGSFSEEGDLLLMGCELAADTAGQSFVSQIATLTGADVAASTDLTGHHSVGGDWDMEYVTGSIEASDFLSDWAQAAYQNVLATFNITSTADSGVGSLRAAIEAANANTEADTININVSGSITLSSELLITDANGITINGNGATIQRNQEVSTRLFNIGSSAKAFFNSLTITGGRALDGGGIFNAGTLTINNSSISGNSSSSSGGGITNQGNLEISNSTFSQNTAATSGGAIANSGGTLTLSNSTLSGNSAGLSGGGIGNAGTATVTNSTLSGNLAGLGGGIINGGTGGTLTVSNSIIAGNTALSGAEIINFRTVNSGGYNLFGFNGNSGLSGVATSTSDITPSGGLNTIFKTLDANGRPVLENNGGPTQTLALVAGSPAIDKGNTDLTTDQRGVARPQGNADDIGAFEFVPPNTAPVANNDSFTTNEDTTLKDNVLTNDKDDDGDNLTVATVNGNAANVGTEITLTNGKLTVNSDGTFTYIPNANANGSDSFTYTLSDGTEVSNTATVSLAITAINDAPVLTVPGKRSVLSGSAQSISGISISDVDAGSGLLTTTISVTAGTLNLNLSGASVSGGKLGSSTVTLSGTLAQLNAALATLTYTSGTFTGNASLSVTVNDKGNTGDGGARSDTEAINLSVARNAGSLGTSALTFQGSLSSSDRVDRYQFTTSATNSFRLTLGNLSADANIRILDSAGNVVAVSTNTGTQSEVINNLRLLAGTYFIEVELLGNISTNYNLSFRR